MALISFVHFQGGIPVLCRSRALMGRRQLRITNIRSPNRYFTIYWSLISLR